MARHIIRGITMKNRLSFLFMILFAIIVFLVSCDSNDQTLYRIQKDGLFGFINNQGEVIIEPQYKYVSEFSKEGFACVINQLKIELEVIPNGFFKSQEPIVFVNYGFIDKKNQKINDDNIMKLSRQSILSYWGEVEELYEMVGRYNNGTLDFRSIILSQIELNDGLYIFQDEETKQFGYKDINNNIVVIPEYERCRKFCNGIAIVGKPKKYFTNEDIVDSLSFYRLANQTGCINTKGELEIDYEYCIIQDFMKDGTTWAMTVALTDYGSVREWVYIDNKGFIITGPFEIPGNIYNNLEYPILQIDFDPLSLHYYTFIDKNKNLLSDFNKDGELWLPLYEDGTPEVFSNVVRFSEGVGGLFANYDNRTGWYYVDSTLIPISTVYDSIRPFSEGMAAVKGIAENSKGSMWGFVKRSPLNNTIIQAIPFNFSECGSFVNGMAYFSNKGRAFNVEGYINMNGDIIWQTKRKNY